MFWGKPAGNKELIEYAEQEAKVLAAFQIDCINDVERAANTLLNVLLAGAGGGLAMAISLYDNESESWLVLGVFFVAIYLFVLAGVLVWKCLWISNLYPPANDPENLYNGDTELLNITLIKYYELEKRQKSIVKNRERNSLAGLWLNRIRAFSALTPIIIIISFLFF